MTTSNPWFSPQLAVTSNRKHGPSGPAVPAGVPVSAPPERCLRCPADISHLWHVRQLCDDCLEWEIAHLQFQNAGVAV